MNRARTREDFASERQYHEREWLAERIGWCVLLGFIIAALLGFFGEGPLSHRGVGDAGTAKLQYERFARHASPTLLTLSVAKTGGAEVSVAISEAYLREFELRSIVPEPHRAELAGAFHRFSFAATETPTTIAFRVVPDGAGRRHGVLIVAGQELAIDQYIYP